MAASNQLLDTKARVNFGSEPNSGLDLGVQRATKSLDELARRRGMRTTVGRWAMRGFLVSMLAGSLFISLLSLPYFDFETLPPFVLEKLPLRFEALWLAALRIHVASAALTFPLCLALMTRALQRRARAHRWLGRSAGVLVLFALLPSGSVLAFDAKGGLIVTIGFLLSAAIIALAMIAGVRAARRRDLPLHAHAMRHVLGQMSVAVVSRMMLVALDALGVDPELAYVAALWVPVLSSVAVVEWLYRRARSLPRKPPKSVERTARETSPLAFVLRVRAFVQPVARNGR